MTTQPVFIIPTKDGKTPLEMLVEDYLDSCRAPGAGTIDGRTDLHVLSCPDPPSLVP